MVVLNRMIVRIRFGKGSKLSVKARETRRPAAGLAAGLGGVLTPAALLAALLALWRIASDMNWTGSFAIHGGFFSHWQVWMVAAAALQLCASLLNRYSKPDQAEPTSAAS
jgi:hypothetical protein